MKKVFVQKSVSIECGRWSFFYVAFAWCITGGDIEYALSLLGIGKNAVKSYMDNILSEPTKRTGYSERRAVCGGQERVSKKGTGIIVP